jgi:hypothetical protein
MSDEPTTIDYLLKHLQEEISVIVEVEENAPSNLKTPITLRFIVSNTRDPNDLPNIIFQDVSLSIGSPPDISTINIPKLAPGESHIYEHLCPDSELPIIKYDVKGSILPESLFQFQIQHNSVYIDKKERMSVEAYKKLIEEINLGKWVHVIPEVALVPTPETTLSELKEQENAFRSFIIEVRNTGQQVQDFSHFQNMDLRNPKRDSLLQHRNMVIEYLQDVEHGLGEFRGLYTSQYGIDMIEITKSKIVSRLSTSLQEIDEAMKRLSD